MSTTTRPVASARTTRNNAMTSLIQRAWYEALSTTLGRLHIVIVEDDDSLGSFSEVPSGRPRRPRRRRRELVLTVTSNIPDFTGLMPGGLELILPVVSRILGALCEKGKHARGRHGE